MGMNLKRKQKRKTEKEKPLDLLLKLDDGRQVIIQRGNAQYMECLYTIGDEYEVDDFVATVEGRDGRKAALQVTRVTENYVYFRILGSCDGEGDVDREGPTVGPEEEAPSE